MKTDYLGRKILFSTLVLVVIIFPDIAKAQSLFGTTGLVTIPTARMQEDGTMSFGLSYFDKKNQEYFQGTRNFGVAYLNFTILPFLEAVIRVNKPLYYHVNGYTFDRFPMLRMRILKERANRPAIILGIHDFASTANSNTVFFNSTYIVLSKKYHDFDVHFGYAPTIIKAQYYQLDGIFGGISYAVNNSVSLMGEYDTRYFNAGLQYQFLKHFAFNAGVINWNALALGLNCKVKL